LLPNPLDQKFHVRERNCVWCTDFTDFHYENSIIQNISKTGCSYDSMPMERFYNAVKQKLIFILAKSLIAQYLSMSMFGAIKQDLILTMITWRHIKPE